MRPLERLEQIDRQIAGLLDGLPSIDPKQPISPGTRNRLHAELARFWATADEHGNTPRQQLLILRKALMLNEIELRLNDETLASGPAGLLRACLEQPLPFQRRHLPLTNRPQVYRVLLEHRRPNWRSYLPGTLVIIAGTAEGLMLTADDATGSALLCSLSQGIEAFDSLAALNKELCERLEDPLQSRPLLHLYLEEQADRARRSQRLRYDWYADSLLEAQVDWVIEAQRQRLSEPALWGTDTTDRHTRLNRAMALRHEVGAKPILQARYSHLLEKNLPNWLRNTPAQGLSHIMQTMQDLVATAERAAAPGVLSLNDFKQRHSLLAWANARLRERLSHDLGYHADPREIQVSIVRARRTGAVMHPFATSSYVTYAGMQRVGNEMVEMVEESNTLEQLALKNLPWFDTDYWLTARMVHARGSAMPPGLTAHYVKGMIRELNVGDSYAKYLHTQLVSSRAGKWRQAAHSRVNLARMRAEAVKARHAGHFGDDPFEHGYHWVCAVLDQPHNALRAPVAGYPVTVRHLDIMGHTLQGVLLLNSTPYKSQACVLYTPDAPDRRAWRRFRTTRELLRTLRQQPRLKAYVAQRLPLLPAATVQHLVDKGRLGTHVKTPAVNDDLFFVYYLAEVQALIAQADADSMTTREVNAESVIALSWRLVDFISLLLPSQALMALSIGRMTIDIWDGVEALKQGDAEGVMRHAYNALSHLNDAAISYVGSGLLRRSLRGMPKQPPLPLPARFQAQPDSSNLRYRIDGIYGEGVYEQRTAFGGLSLYFVKDDNNRYYQVSFDGYRWRAIDPDQPDAYLQQPVKRKADGQWVIDSPVHWYDGLPDLPQLLQDCYLQAPLAGAPVNIEQGLYQADDQLYLALKGGQLPVRSHLLPDRYHLEIALATSAGVVPWAVLRHENGQWLIRVRQAGRSSDWLALPDQPLPAR
ncbi:dermonecrotic toxin domain-containing protein [Pseudomonas sp. WOUb67]|uniref:dermonecrotic toxin domain-containing protein n=1 Tax=Pseudomonas sp. WOUb67 TaxID=3161136 RepID=UPI003CF152B0